MANDNIYIRCINCGELLLIAGYLPSIDLQLKPKVDITGFLNEHLYHHPDSENYETDLSDSGFRFITDKDPTVADPVLDFITFIRPQLEKF